MRSLRELQDGLQKKQLSVADLTREECVLLFGAWTEEYRHGRLQDEELFLACAQRIRSFHDADKPNEGACLVGPEAELRGQIFAEKKKQAGRMRKLIPLAAGVCILGVCSVFMIAASVRTVSLSIGLSKEPLWDSGAADACDRIVSEWNCLAVSDSTSNGGVSDWTIGSLPPDTDRPSQESAAASVSKEVTQYEPSSVSMDTAESFPDCELSFVPEDHRIRDLESLQSEAEQMFGKSPLLPWSFELALQQANGIYMNKTGIVLCTEDMQLEIQPVRLELNVDGIETSREESFADEVCTNAGCSADEPFSYTFCLDGFCYRLTVRDAKTFGALMDALK